jgi:hypothetical protein
MRYLSLLPKGGRSNPVHAQEIASQKALAMTCAPQLKRTATRS